MLQLVEYKTTAVKMPRMGQLGLDAGSTVWLIRHIDTDRYFSYCYIKKSDATKVMQSVNDNWNAKSLSRSFVDGADRPLHIWELNWPTLDAKRVDPGL